MGMQDFPSHRGDPLVLGRRLDAQQARKIASGYGYVCIDDDRILDVIKQKKSQLKDAIRETYCRRTGNSQLKGAISFEYRPSTPKAVETGNPILNYNTFSYREKPEGYEFSDTFLVQNHPGVQVLKPISHTARRSVHMVELDGIASVVRSADVEGFQQIYYNMVEALDDGANLEDSPEGNSIIRHGYSGNAQKLLYPVWEVPVREEYEGKIIVDVQNDKRISELFSRRLTFDCLVPYEGRGAIFVDAVSGQVYYTKKSDFYFDRKNPSSPKAKFRFSLRNSEYEGFRFLTEEEAMREARKIKMPDMYAVPGSNYANELDDEGKSYVSANESDFPIGMLLGFPTGAIIGGSIASISFLYDHPQDKGLFVLLGFAGWYLGSGVMSVYFYNRRAKNRYIKNAAESIMQVPVSLGQLPDPQEDLWKEGFEMEI